MRQHSQSQVILILVAQPLLNCGSGALVESEYRRHGTLAYLAAYDVHHARVIGHCAASTGIGPFTALVTKSDDPRALRQRQTGVLDCRQRCLHRGWTAAARLCDAFPNAVMIHTPVHASWLNTKSRSTSQSSSANSSHPTTPLIWTPLTERLTAFEARYNQAAQPFDWTFNRADIDRLLQRIAA
jgi:hypothetical protein